MSCKMKNVAIINTCDWGSTGKIAKGLLQNFKLKGFNAIFYYGRGKDSTSPDMVKIDNELDFAVHIFMTRLTGVQGGWSYRATKKLISSLISNQIDTIFIISIHGYYINEKMLYEYISSNNIRMILTMIDEYAYLGECTNEPECETYKKGYGKCPNIKKYPSSWFADGCEKVIKRKKDCYSKLNNAVFVGPEFLVKNCRESFLGKFMNSSILDEAIDLKLYSPKDSSSLRAKHNICENQKVILCVAPSTNPMKGSSFFWDLARRFEEDDSFVFIHIGYRSSDKSTLPSNLIPISFVEKDEDLAYYYSLADLFVNPSLADAMSNTCLESLACGTPLLCFDLSGMPYLMDNTVGTLVTPKNVDELEKVIRNTPFKSLEMINKCRLYAELRYDNAKYADKLISIANNDSLFNNRL